MANVLKPGQYHGSRRATAYACALILPFASFLITRRTPALHSFPFALHFLSVALIATLGGFGPALLAVALSVGLRFFDIYVSSAGPFPWALEALRSAILLCIALIICFVNVRRRRSEARLEHALTELQERTDALVETLSSSKCATWVFNADHGESARFYAGSYPIFGRPFSEVEHLSSLEELLDPEDRPRFPGLIDHMRSSDDPIVFEFRVPWPTGELHWLEMRGTRMSGPGRRWRGVTLDITERKQSEAALLRSEKLAAMGRLASTVAHEINNPLEAVTDLLYLAHGDPDLTSETRGYIGTAERELARIGNITRLTLGFTANSGSASTIDLASSVDDVLSVFQHRLETRSIVVLRHYEPEICVTMPLHELRQVATNLISNAADAVSGPASTIMLRVQRWGHKAVFLVEDNGEGIPPDNMKRIFEPFFSTKGEVGSGIGLWVTREIVEKNGGRISVETGDFPGGIRTRFRVELPIDDSPEAT